VTWNDARWELAERNKQDEFDARQAAQESEILSMSDDLYQAAMKDLDGSIHGNRTGAWVDGKYRLNVNPEPVWETIKGAAEYDGLDRQVVAFLASEAKAKNPAAIKLLDAICNKYAQMRYEES